MQVRIKKLNERAVMPLKTYPTDAGYDLTATDMTYDEHGNIRYGTGLAFEIPEGYAGFLFPRSSNSKKQLILSNCVGVIDSHYRGEVTAKFKPSISFGGSSKLGNRTRQVNSMYKIGDRICQMIIMPVPQIEFVEADELNETDRGDGGYGSTGE